MAEENLGRQCSSFPENLRRQRGAICETFSACNCRFPFHRNSVFCADDVGIFLRPLLLLSNDATRINWLGNNIIPSTDKYGDIIFNRLLSVVQELREDAGEKRTPHLIQNCSSYAQLSCKSICKFDTSV